MQSCLMCSAEPQSAVCGLSGSVRRCEWRSSLRNLQTDCNGHNYHKGEMACNVKGNDSCHAFMRICWEAPHSVPQY